MTKLRYVHWQEEDFPDYVTQGSTPQELLENLRDLYKDIASGEIPYIKKVDELVLAE